MKTREFFKRWGDGIKNLSPLSMLKSKRIGIFGSIFGIIMAAIVLVSHGAWYWLIIGFFIIWLQVLELISCNQQINNAIAIQKRLNAIGGKNEK